MSDLRLPLNRGELAEQWTRIRRRSAPTAGGRQEPFVALEAVLCAAAALLVNHRSFGGATSSLAPSPVPELAALFKRTNASILAKMANVDGSRPHGAKQDPLIADQILGRPDRLTQVYSDILRTARHAGIDSTVLPDFLGLESASHELTMLGQDEIEPELASVVEARLIDWGQPDGPAQTARLAEVNLRIGQHRFARDVLNNYGGACGFCGLTSPFDTNRGLLRASHIKAWAASSDRERLDVKNGIAACPTHDTAFDAGLLTVNGGLRIHLSHALAKRAQEDEPTRHAFGRPPLRETLLVPEPGVPPAPRYLGWHREHVWAA